MSKNLFKCQILVIASVFFILPQYLFSQKCATYSMKEFDNSAACPDNENLKSIIRIKKIGNSFSWRWQSDNSKLTISPCGIKLEIKTKRNLGGTQGQPEDIVVSGDLTETSRSSELRNNVLSVRSACAYDTTGKQWRFFKLGFDNIDFLKYNANDPTLVDARYKYTIDSVIHPFTIGMGANLRDLDKFGAYGKFRVKDSPEPGTDTSFFEMELTFLLDSIATPRCDKCDIIADTKPPVFTNCPQNIEKTSISDKDCVVVNWQEPTATDESGAVSVSSNFKGGFCFPVGSTKVIYTATDAANNKATCFFDITIKPKPTTSDSCIVYKLKDFSCVGCKPYTAKIKNLSTGAISLLPISNGKISISPCGSKIFINAKDSTKSGGVKVKTEDLTLSGDLTETSRAEVSAFSFITSYKINFDSIVRTQIFISDRDTTITRFTSTDTSKLQIGIGANQINSNELGGSGKFIVSDTRDINIKYELELVFLLDSVGKPDCEKCNTPITDTKPPVFNNCPQNIEKTSTSDKDCVVVNWQEPTATDESSIPSVSSNFKSGFCFPIGVTTVIYTAKDAAGNTANCSFVVNIKPKPLTECTQYTVENTNQRCNPQTFKPYALNINNVLYQAEKVTFEQRIDNTAILSGIFRDTLWNPIKVNIQLTSYTTSISANKITTGHCLSRNALNTAGWFFYSSWSGTIQYGDDQPLSIRGYLPFQFGKGANLQDLDELGGTAQFFVKGSIALLSFKLLNPRTCNTIVNTSSKDILYVTGTVEPQKTKIVWVENIATENDVFTLEKLVNGQFEAINIINPTIKEGLHQYTSYDEQPNDGINIYRVILRNNYGTKVSNLIPLNFKKQTYAYVFPNPVDGDINISMSEKPKGKVTIRLYNATGYEVKTMNVESEAASLVQMTTDNLPTGLYILRISQIGKRDFSQQVIIKK